MIRKLVSFSIFVLAAACAEGNDGNDSNDGEPLAHQIDDMREHADALRSEVEAHGIAAEAAVDLAALQALEGAHRDRVDEHMDMLGHAIGDMAMCEGVPDDDVDGMMMMRDMCADELERHRQAIAGAADLAAARAEEQAHRTAMMERLHELDGRADGMMDGHGTMMCGGHHGLDDHEG